MFLCVTPFRSRFSDRISQTTVLRIEPTWDNNSAPALIKTKDYVEKHHEPRRTEETKTSTNKARGVDSNNSPTFLSLSS
jgi:hypothetical protein